MGTNFQAGGDLRAHLFFRDAKIFLLSNRYIIETAPLQIYASALLFTPHESLVRNYFGNSIPSWILNQPEIVAPWNPGLQILSGHKDNVYCIAFSPDGLLASESSGELRVWDPLTGRLIQSFQAHQEPIWAIAFASNGRLATASSDHSIGIWDPKLGIRLHSLQGHSEPVRELAFAPDNTLASGSETGVVKTWNIDSGTANKTFFNDPDQDLGRVRTTVLNGL